MMNHLMKALTRLTTILNGLVDVAQREQSHLIAFEPARLNICNDERAELLAQQREAEDEIREHMATLRETLGVEESDTPTLLSLTPYLEDSLQTTLIERADCLKALSGTLQELHRMNAVQAERGLKTVRSYLSLLVDTARGDTTPTYDAKGRSRRTTDDWVEVSA
jgi:flagellar biosynthesis/type III secretory pathway chaperone